MENADPEMTANFKSKTNIKKKKYQEGYQKTQNIMLTLNLATKFNNVYQKSYNLTKFIIMSKKRQNCKFTSFFH
jgi:hypothetical protein